MNYKKAFRNNYKPKHKEPKEKSYCSKNYGISFHAIQRWNERVFGRDELKTEDIEPIINIILGSLDFELTDKLNGIFPLLDDYKIVVKNGIIITVKYA